MDIEDIRQKPNLEEETVMQLIETTKAAIPLGHYSQAVICSDLIFVSGILPIEPGEKPDSSRSFEEQVDCVLRNASEILQEAKSNLSKVVKVTVYVTDVDNWSEFDRIYAGRFGAHKPARAVAPVSSLHHGFNVEIDLIAATSDNRT